MQVVEKRNKIFDGDLAETTTTTSFKAQAGQKQMQIVLGMANGLKGQLMI